MKTTDPRDMTYEEIKATLAGPRERVWLWLLSCGPATTSQVSEGTGIPLLTVRPRVCELAALGLVEITGRQRREGVYRALTLEELRARRQAEARHDHQLPLKLS
jgi:sugar-specific transcriptional regulator TrmB